ncbi:MAG: hypothetical protein FWF42_03340 [Streptococcaceae bacterium]|nr:hypothetical protein [Streptococcaceae bacterium]MCL2681138.1 hypothetical protein [Streptococcaceae bacterium]MCL2858704.1 hypothetical protein [Streptococcaceae bacterium]
MSEIQTIPELIQSHADTMNKATNFNETQSNVTVSYTDIEDIVKGATYNKQSHDYVENTKNTVKNFAKDIGEAKDKIVAEDKKAAQK